MINMHIFDNLLSLLHNLIILLSIHSFQSIIKWLVLVLKYYNMLDPIK